MLCIFFLIPHTCLLLALMNVAWFQIVNKRRLRLDELLQPIIAARVTIYEGCNLCPTLSLSRFLFFVLSCVCVDPVRSLPSESPLFQPLT